MQTCKNLVVQLLDISSPSEHTSRTTALLNFSAALNCLCTVIDDEFRDSFVILLSDNDYEFCHQVNAFFAYCHFQNLALKLE